MMRHLRLRLLLATLIGLCGAAPAIANAPTVVVMNQGNQAAALAALRPGDVLQLEGTFTSRVNISNRDFGGVRVDASRATLLEGMQLTNVHNIAFNGGVWGRADVDTRDWYAARINNSSNVAITNAQYVGNGNTAGAGMFIVGSRHVTVRDSSFSGFVNGMVFNSSTDSLLTRNSFIGSRSDGIQIGDSHRVIMSENRCTGFAPSQGAHPDCIQLMTSNAAYNAGNPQSHLYLLNNYAHGEMQAFVAFDSKAGATVNVTFAGNYAAVTYPHGVSCYSCRDAVIVDNMFVTVPEAPWNVGLRTINSTNVVATNNRSFDLRPQTGNPPVLPEHVWSSLVPSIADTVGSLLVSRSWNSRMTPITVAQAVGETEPVPEPATWLMMGAGFAMIGRALRRNREGLRRTLA